MSRSLNWQSAKQAIDASKSGGNRSGFRFFISDGETVPVRFLIPEDGSEPFVYKRHYINNKGYHVCAEEVAAEGKHDGCVFCYQAKAGGKKGNPIGLAQTVGAVSLFDPRKTHVFKEEQRGLDGKTSKYHPCPDDPSCKFCRKGDEPRVNGVRHWTLSGKVLGALSTWERTVLGQTCAVCRGGKIKVISYACPECEEELQPDDPTQETRCIECSKLSKKQGKSSVVMVMPKEVVKCSRGCEDARRLSLGDVWVMITRSGGGQETTYNYTRGDDEATELPSDVAPVDFKRNPEFKPAPANEQAATLGMRNPYSGRGRGGAPDDDDEEDVPFDQDTADDDGPIFGRKR